LSRWFTADIERGDEDEYNNKAQAASAHSCSPD
jgi:hypothetical protein